MFVSIYLLTQYFPLKGNQLDTTPVYQKKKLCCKRININQLWHLRKCLKQIPIKQLMLKSNIDLKIDFLSFIMIEHTPASC